ncbi:hypothetical protein RDABS01_020757 [Bienertia sinuspersici]
MVGNVLPYEDKCFKLVCYWKVEKIQRSLFPAFTTVNLPKLKLLCFSYGERNQPFETITMLISSYPSLEVLNVTLDSLLNSPRISIVAPNLKSLSFKMCNAIEQHQVIIDAPKLTYIYVIGGGSLIDFVMDPTELDIVDIDLTIVRELHLESNIKLFAYTHSVGSMPLFGNLSYARITLIGSKPLADITQSVVVVRESLLNILNYVNVTALQGNNNEVNLVGYIFKNAIGLDHLYMRVNVDDAVEDEDARVGREYKFCKACFRLPIMFKDKGCVLRSVPQSKQ